MKKFMNLVFQDTVILSRNWIFYVLPIMALGLILITNFVIPKEMSPAHKPKIIFYEPNGDEWENYIRKVENIKEDDKVFYESEEALKNAVKTNNNSMGIIVEGSLSQPKLRVIHQGTESPVVKRMLEVSLESVLRRIDNTKIPDNYEVTFLREKAKPIPFNQAQMPFFVFMEAGLLGLFLVIILIFQEKQEGSIRAYRVTPGGVISYMASKISIIAFFSMLYAFVMTVFTIGLGINWLYFFLLTFLGSLVMTLLGFISCVFFKSLSEYLFIMIALMTVLSLPVMSYYMPSFSPAVLTWIPTYPILFGYREIFFPTGKEMTLLMVGLTLLIECAVLFVGTYFAVKFKLMKEGK